MRKALIIIATVALLGVLAAYFNPLGPEGQPIASKPTGGTNTPATTQAATTDTSTSDGPAPTSPPQAMHMSGYRDGTYKGGDYSSQYGDVQVSVAIQDGKITAVTFDQLTSYDSRSREINNYAAPYLKQQTLSAQSATIDGVSGATYTSSDYVRSLQSALDQAKA
jgi:uncharacterized protein with FMN-binding domain